MTFFEWEEKNRKHLLSLAMASTRYEKVLVEDAYSIVFLKLVEKKWEPDLVDTPFSYVLRAIKNTCFTLIRNKKDTLTLQDVADYPAHLNTEELELELLIKELRRVCPLGKESYLEEIIENERRNWDGKPKTTYYKFLIRIQNDFKSAIREND